MKLTNAHKAAFAVILAMLVAWLVYPVLRPAKRDACASEILINARGGKVDLKTRTISVGAQNQPVPLDKMTNDSQVLIDQLARLCRQNAEGQISSEQYYDLVEKLLRRTDAAPAPPTSKVPLFNGEIGVTGLVDNRPFRRFAETNEGKIVRLRLRLDAGAYNPVGVHFLEQCYEGINENGERVSSFPGMADNLFGKRFSLIRTEKDIEEYAELTEEQKRIGCGPTVEFHSARNLTWSNGGPGLIYATIDGFFRESTEQMGAGQTYRFDEVTGSVTEYAQAQD